MKLGMQVGLGPGHIVLGGDPAPPPQKGVRAPQIFGPCLLWPNGWKDQDGTRHGVRPHPRGLCVRWGPSPPHQKGGGAPNFRPMSTAAERLHGSRCQLVRMLGEDPVLPPLKGTALNFWPMSVVAKRLDGLR